jgi:hypothetical protein
MSKKIAVVASGWHYPYSFYEMLSKQRKVDGWEVDLFVVSHRDPKHALKEKADRVFEGERAYLDEILYKKIPREQHYVRTPRVSEIEKLGWKYIEKPNTIGDWGNTNQWLEDYDYKKYDLFLFTHDDNLILSDKLFRDIIEDDNFGEWDILCNSVGMPPGSIRGSFEFFKPAVLDRIGGKFDLSETTLTREGETSATENLTELYDWNSTVYPLQRVANEMRLGFLSPAYRVSAYCIEGERGYISNTHGANTEREDAGLAFLKEHGVI